MSKIDGLGKWGDGGMEKWKVGRLGDLLYEFMLRIF